MCYILKYIGRAPDGSRLVLNISPGTLQWSAGAPKGSRAAPVHIVRYAVYLFTKIGKKLNAQFTEPVLGRAPYATLRVLNGLFTGRRFDENTGKIGSSLFDTPAPVRVVKIVPAPSKSEGSRAGTVRIWPKYPFSSPYGKGRGFHKSLPGPVGRGKWIFWPYPYGARPAPFRFHGRRDNFKNPHGRRCVEDAAPNSPGVLFILVAFKQPVKDPAGCTRGPPGDRPENGRAPRDSFSPILVNKYNGHRTVSKGAGRLPFGARADP